MDHQRADDLESSHAVGARRRGMLRGLAAGVAAVALGRLGGETAAKRKKKKKSICQTCPKICETPNVVLCKPSSNLEIEECVCARTTTGESTCVNIAGGIGCSATDQCVTDADCPTGAACIKVDGVNCCPSPDQAEPAPTGNLCKPVCKQKK